jgi:hypothetical protein
MRESNCRGPKARMPVAGGAEECPAHTRDVVLCAATTKTAGRRPRLAHPNGADRVNALRDGLRVGDGRPDVGPEPHSIRTCRDLDQGALPVHDGVMHFVCIKDLLQFVAHQPNCYVTAITLRSSAKRTHVSPPPYFIFAGVGISRTRHLERSRSRTPIRPAEPERGALATGGHFPGARGATPSYTGGLPAVQQPARRSQPRARSTGQGFRSADTSRSLTGCASRSRSRRTASCLREAPQPTSQCAAWRRLLRRGRWRAAGSVDFLYNRPFESKPAS